MTAPDGLGESSVGEAIGCASTIRSFDSGPVCRIVPLWPSLTPRCESRTNGCPPEAAIAAGDTKVNVKNAAAAPPSVKRIDRAGSIRDSGWFRKHMALPLRAKNALPYPESHVPASRS